MVSGWTTTQTKLYHHGIKGIHLMRAKEIVALRRQMVGSGTGLAHTQLTQEVGIAAVIFLNTYILTAGVPRVLEITN